MARRRAGRPSLGVDWYLPGQRVGARPFATTTMATSHLIELAAVQGHTVDSAWSWIMFDDEAKAVLAYYSRQGLGGVPLRDVLRPDGSRYPLFGER